MKNIYDMKNNDGKFKFSITSEDVVLNLFNRSDLRGLMMCDEWSFNKLRKEGKNRFVKLSGLFNEVEEYAVFSYDENIAYSKIKKIMNELINDLKNGKVSFLNHGGKREGAGRPKKPRTKKNYSFYLTDEQAEKVKNFVKNVK